MLGLLGATSGQSELHVPEMKTSVCSPLHCCYALVRSGVLGGPADATVLVCVSWSEWEEERQYNVDFLTSLSARGLSTCQQNADWHGHESGVSESAR